MLIQAEKLLFLLNLTVPSILLLFILDLALQFYSDEEASIYFKIDVAYCYYFLRRLQIIILYIIIIILLFST